MTPWRRNRSGGPDPRFPGHVAAFGLLWALAVLPILAGLLEPRLLERLLLPSGIGPGYIQQDWWAFYGGARAGWDGAALNPWDAPSFAAYVGAPTRLLWLYPPTMLLLLAPFGALPFGAVKVAWIGTCLGASLLLARLAAGTYRRSALVALSPAGWVALFVGQPGAVFGLWLAAGLRLARGRPLVAGVCLALLTVKPQYALLAIPFLAVVGAWKALRTAVVLSLALAGASWLAFGGRTWRWFLDSLAEGAGSTYLQAVGHPVRINAMNALAGLGIPTPPAWALYGILWCVAVAGLVRLRDRTSTELLAAYALAASACVAPYFLVYDYFPVYAAILMVRAEAPRLSAWHGAVHLAVWLAPLVPFLFVSPLAPTLLWPLNVACAGAIYRAASGGAPAPAAA